MVEYDQRYVQLHARVDVPFCPSRSETGIGADEVDSEWPRSQAAQSFYHHEEAIRRIRGCSQHTQSAGICDRGGKLLVCDEAHPRPDERMPETALAGQPRRKGGDIPRRAYYTPLVVVDYRFIPRVGHGLSLPYSNSEYLQH